MWLARPRGGLAVVLGCALIVACLLFGASPARAEPAPAAAAPSSGTEAPAPASSKKLVVGVHPVEPFVIQNADGSWSGISVDLWRRIAARLGLDYEIRRYEISQLLEPEANGIDVVVSVNVSAHNERAMDVTHAFYSTGLTITTRAEQDSAWSAIWRKILTLNFLKWFGAFVGILVAMGTVVWRLERAANPDEFGGPAWKGIAHGVFWAFESVVGKASQLSRSRTNRAVALAWAMAIVLLVSYVTAKLASELTLNQLRTTVSGPADLPRVRVGTVKPSQSARYLDRRRIDYVSFDNVAQAMEALDQRRVDAVVYEAPILRYYATKHYARRVVVLPGTFENHGYGFGLRAPNDLRKKIDLALLDIVESDEWPPLLSVYLGSSM